MTDKPIRRTRRSAPARRGTIVAGPRGGQRYRRLPGGNHGLDPEQVRLDQAERLRRAMVELIAANGYPAVRISDLARLAHVSPPSLYSLYADKQELLIDSYEQISQRATEAIASSQRPGDPPERRLEGALLAFAELAVREPQAISLLVLGAFGAGPGALRRRRRMLEGLEAFVHSTRDPGVPLERGDMIVQALLGGIREVTANRLRAGRQAELPGLAPELARWTQLYPSRLPEGLAGRAPEPVSAVAPASERARRAGGRLPSGRSDLPRELIVSRQRERIVDATAAIVAERGLSALTVPEIARRASISNQTFYSFYRSKQEAFLGAQKVGMHQALQVTVDAAGAALDATAGAWPDAIASGLRALLAYLASEPAHAHLTLVDTFAASPQALAVRDTALAAFAAHLSPGFELAAREENVPDVAAEAVVGGIWQVLHHYAEAGCAHALPTLAPQLTYFTLTPFLGAERAAERARREL